MIVVTLKILEICEDTCDKNVSIKVLQRFNLRLDIKLKDNNNYYEVNHFTVYLCIH